MDELGRVIVRELFSSLKLGVEVSFVRTEGRDIDREGSQNHKFLITVENEKKEFSGEDTIATPNLWIEFAKSFGNQLDDNRNTNRISKEKKELGNSRTRFGIIAFDITNTTT